MEVSFYLKRPKATIQTVIFARVCYEGYKIKFYTPENILPKYWNGTTQRAKESKKFIEYPEFNTRLDNIETTIRNTIRKYVNDHENKYPTPAVLKPLLDAALRQGGKIDKLTFMQFYEDFIKRSESGLRLVDGKPITQGTIKSYYTTKKCIENYQDHAKTKVDFENIDMSFYTEFTKYLTLTVKQSTNYIGKHIKVIKTVLRDAKDNFKISVNEDFAARNFKTIKEEADTIYLAEFELKEIAGLDLSNNQRLDKVRDLFLIGCYTGLRFSDLSALTPDQISNGMITITQIKTGGKVVIPVHDIVNGIMNKYNGMLPKALSNQKTNAALKDLAKLVPSLKKKISAKITKGGVITNKIITKATKEGLQKSEVTEKWQLVTTHTARRSFSTNQYLNGVPTLSIMAITGHKTESAFMKYIKVTNEDQAKILKGIWIEQKEKEVKRIAI